MRRGGLLPTKFASLVAGGERRRGGRGLLGFDFNGWVRYGPWVAFRDFQRPEALRFPMLRIAGRRAAPLPPPRGLREGLPPHPPPRPTSSFGRPSRSASVSKRRRGEGHRASRHADRRDTPQVKRPSRALAMAFSRKRQTLSFA